LALGFVHVTHDGLVRDLDIQLDDRGNIKMQNHQTSQPWVFAAGDAASGASLVVRAIKSGRDAAAAIDRWLSNN
jgi:glutamate synthase (NADPH/NADH) small chain